MKVEVASKFALGKVPLTRHAIPHQASLFLMPAAHQTCTPQNPHELSTITPGTCSTSEQLHLTPVNLVMIVPMPVYHPQRNTSRPARNDGSVDCQAARHMWPPRK